MGLTFLNPWFWLGLLAVAAPIWLHLRRKARENLQPFSTLRFLQDQPIPKESPMRLRDLLLLLLRVAALLLLVAAFSWPFLRELAPVIRESRIYLLDNTLSHQTGDGFNRDRDRIIQELKRPGREVQMAVIELTSLPRVVVAFGDEPELACRKMRELKPSFQRGSFLAAFQQANSLFQNSLGNRKRIVVCSDNQQNQWSENADLPPFLHGVEVELPKILVTEGSNLSLAEPKVQRIFLGEKSVVNFMVTLNRQGPARNAKVTLRVNGQVIFSRELDLLQAGTSIPLQAQWEADPSLWLRGEVLVEGEPDLLAADNRLFFALPPVREGTVLLLSHSPYLRLALSPEVMRGHWAARVLEAGKIGQELSAGHDAEVLCIESSYLQSADARRLVQRYLSNGRGVFLMVDRVTPLALGALRELGVEVQPAPEEGNRLAAERIEYVFPNHAIFHPFVAMDFGNLAEIQILQHARLKSTAAMPLMFSQSGDGLFFQGIRTIGRFYLCAFGLDRDQTSWPLHTTFIPFLDLCLQSARGEDDTPASFEPGELYAMRLPADSAAHEVVLREDQKELCRWPVVQNRVQLRLPDIPGIYALTFDGGKEPEKLLCVNPSPKESQLFYVQSPEALKNWMVPVASETAPLVPSSMRLELSMSAIYQQRVWWWLMLAGAVALVAEGLWLSLRKERA